MRKIGQLNSRFASVEVPNRCSPDADGRIEFHSFFSVHGHNQQQLMMKFHVRPIVRERIRKTGRYQTTTLRWFGRWLVGRLVDWLSAAAADASWANADELQQRLLLQRKQVVWSGDTTLLDTHSVHRSQY